MRRSYIAALVAGSTLAACGGGDDLSAADLEKRLVSGSHVRQDDPVTSASCAKGLGADDGAKATCTTTSRGGAISDVTVTRRGEDGIAYDSAVRAVTKAKIEGDVRRKHDLDTKAEEFKAAKVACPGSFSLKPGSFTRCELTVELGAVYVYAATATDDGISIELAAAISRSRAATIAR